MSWLLCMDESGHDHRTMPYEVRGGVPIHARRLWQFTQRWRQTELDAFGAELAQYKKELKGCKLLDKDRFKWARQGEWMDAEVRRKHSRGFLTKGLEKKPPTQQEFTAYGQACIEMARSIFQLLDECDAVLFAAVIPRGVQRPQDGAEPELLRKDHVFLLERYFYFLEDKREHGLLVMDEVEKTEDRRFIRRLENYFTKTGTGRSRTTHIVPVPFFVSSDMTYAVQAADLCMYCINWGFRLPEAGMSADGRPEVAEEFAPWIRRLRFFGEGYREGKTFRTYGIAYVPDPYSSRRQA